jgi:glycerate kinase
MSLRVLIVPDKFKGTLTAQAAAGAMGAGWARARPEDVVTLLPMSDGGDGFGIILSELIGAKAQAIKTVDAAGQALEADWWWEPTTRTAIIESANIVGLALLPPGKFHPFELDTFGLGKVIQAAAKKGARRCLVGIGGSATNDGGFGVARALGWEFEDETGQLIERWTELWRLNRILPPARTRWFEELLVAVDVQNPLLGPRGCSRIYGPQKGLRKKDYPLAEKCLGRLAEKVATDLNRNCGEEPGMGAAGGLGFGLRCFVGARLQPGFDMLARHAELARKIRESDLVITGEGSIDKSTLMGKGVGEIAAHCRKLNVPCMGIAGVVSDITLLKKRFTAAHGLATEYTSTKNALERPAQWLEKFTAKLAKEYQR